MSTTDESVPPDPPPKRRGRPPKPPLPYPGEQFSLKESQVVDMPLDKLDLDDLTFELRVYLRPELLVDSIRTHGIQMPLVVRKHPDAGRKSPYQIVCGFRRANAARMLGLATVPAVVRTLTDEQAHVLAFSENEQRKTLTDLDRANGIAMLRRTGRKPEEVAQLLRLSERQVRRLVELLEYPAIIKRAVANDVISTTHATVIMQDRRKRGEKCDLAYWILFVKGNRASAEELRRTIRENAALDDPRPRPMVVRRGDKVSFSLDALKKASPSARRNAIERLRAMFRKIEG